MTTQEEVDLDNVAGATGRSPYSHDSTVQRRRFSDHQNVPESHQNLKLELYTAGGYAVVEKPGAPLPSSFSRGEYGKTQHRLFNEVDTQLNWKPWLSGRTGRLLQLFALLATITLYLRIVQQVREYGTSTASRFGPGVLAIFLANITRFLSRQELHRAENQVTNSVVAMKTHRRCLLAHEVVVIALLSSLISLPVLRAAKLASVTKEGKSPDYVEWDQVINNLQTFDNLIGSKSVMADPTVDFSAWPESIDSRWEIQYDNLSKTLPNSVAFLGEHRPLDIIPISAAADGLGVLRPFSPVGDIPGHVLVAQWPATVQWILSGYLECEKLEVPTGVMLQQSEKTWSASVTVTDSEGCVADFAFSSLPNNSEQRHYLPRLLSKFVTYLERIAEEPRSLHTVKEKADALRRRLAKYATQLHNAPNVVAFLPTWKPGRLQGGRGDEMNCNRKYMFAAFADPVTVVNSDGSVGNIQAASCSTQFQELRVDVNAITPYPNLFRQPRKAVDKEELFSLDIQPHMPDPLEGVFDPNWKHDQIVYAPWGKPRSIMRDGQFHATVDEILHRNLENTTLFNHEYLAQMLQYQFLAFSNIESDSYHAIAYGSKMLMSMVHHMLAGAASITLREDVSTQGWYSKWEPYTSTFLQIRLLQTERWFQGLFFVAATVSMFLLYLSHCFADDASSGLPFDISSIAARAALLSRSRLPQAFQSNDNGPDSIHKLRPLRMGYYAVPEDDNSSYWKIDSLLSQCSLDPPEKADLRWRKHSLRSVSLTASFYVLVPVMCLLIAVISTAWKYLGHERETIRDNALSNLSSIIPLFLGTATELPRPFVHNLCLRILPAIAAMSVIHLWYERLISFYKKRLPWAGLMQNEPTNKSLTLDYINTLLPLWKAIKNKHWMLATLIAGSISLLPLPLVATNFYSYEWIVRDVEKISVPREHSWDFSQFQPADNSSMAQVLQLSLQSVANSSALPRWSSFRQALLPVDLASVELAKEPEPTTLDRVGYWEVETDMVRAELKCDSLPYEVDTGSRKWHFVNVPRGVEVDPCFQHSDGEIFDYDTNTNCSHWRLVDLTSRNTRQSTDLVWAISAVQLVEGFTVSPQLLVCRPRFYTSKGTAQLLAMDGQLRNAHVHAYNASEEESLLTGDLSQHFSWLLNQTMLQVKSNAPRHGGLHLSRQGISTAKFRGDILSFLSYRWAIEAGEDLNQGDTLEKSASQIFSALFAVAVQSLGFLDVPTPGKEAEVVRRAWVEQLRFSRPLTVAVLAYAAALIIVILLHATIILRKKEYLYPTAPEPLENSLYLLYRSQLISETEEHIPHPENLSLKQFYRRLDGLGMRCGFGLLDPEQPLTKATVLVADEVEEPPRQQHPGERRSGNDALDQTPLLDDLELGIDS